MNRFDRQRAGLDGALSGMIFVSEIVSIAIRQERVSVTGWLPAIGLLVRGLGGRHTLRHAHVMVS